MECANCIISNIPIYMTVIKENLLYVAFVGNLTIYIYLSILVNNNNSFYGFIVVILFLTIYICSYILPEPNNVL